MLDVRNQGYKKNLCLEGTAQRSSERNSSLCVRAMVVWQQQLARRHHRLAYPARLAFFRLHLCTVLRISPGRVHLLRTPGCAKESGVSNYCISVVQVRCVQLVDISRGRNQKSRWRISTGSPRDQKGKHTRIACRDAGSNSAVQQCPAQTYSGEARS